MKSSSPIALYVLCLMYLIAGLTVTYLVVVDTAESSRQKTSATEMMSLETRFEKVADEAMADREETLAMYDWAHKGFTKADEAYDSAVTEGWMLAAGTFVLLLLVFAWYYQGPMFNRAMTVVLITISTVLLVMGVFAPLLEIIAYVDDLGEEVEFWGMSFDLRFYGKMYAHYANKSIAGVIGLLWSQGSYFVAAAILAFSVLIPVGKLALMLLVLFAKSLKQRKKITKVVQWIGKWSMADVFVVALFLAILGLNNMQTGVDVETNDLMGTYFFLGYCIVSIVSSLFLKKTIIQEDGLGEPEVKPHYTDYP